MGGDAASLYDAAALSGYRTENEETGTYDIASAITVLRRVDRLCRGVRAFRELLSYLAEDVEFSLQSLLSRVY